MDEARNIWAELRSRDWVNPDLDFDEIMEKLAGHWDPWTLLARQKDPASGSGPFHGPVISGPRVDQELIDRLYALARAPYEAMPWPDPPEVELSRLADDYERTLGRRIEFSWAWEADPNGDYWSISVLVDGSVVGGCGEELTGVPEEDLVRLTDRLQSEHMGDELEGDWPKCPHHGNIVMLPKIVSGVASWTCRADPGHHVRIGNLAIDLF